MIAHGTPGGGDLDARIVAAIAEAGAALRRPGEKVMIAEVGAERWRGLDLREKLGATVRLWAILARRGLRAVTRVRRGQLAARNAAIASYVGGLIGRVVTPSLLSAWEAKYQAGGAARLVDRRGKRRAHVLIPVELMATFCRLVNRGLQARAAHGRVAKRAARQRIWWPCWPTLRRRLCDGTLAPERVNAAHGRVGAQGKDQE
jgi:hypothetical protein